MQSLDWRQTAAARLADILTHRDLGGLLGELLNSARATLRQRKGHDTSGSKLDFARALLLIHHEDLLAYQPARDVVARRCEVDPPGRWHPGKASALKFVRACDLPLALAGIPAGERGPDIEYLDSPPALPPLADFQEEVASTLLAQLGTPGGRAILSLPTGAGKFRPGRIQVLCNCEVLTTGFDDPRVTHVVMSRQTVSQVLYEQMVGRGLRGPQFGGTETCVVMDCVDELQPGVRLTLRYQGFREVWRPRRRASAAS